MSTDRRVPTLDELRARRDEILRIAAARGAREVRVFGSVARQESRPASDVDFLVVFDSDRTGLDSSELILDLQDALGWSVDVVEARQDTPIAERIRQEAVLL